MRERLENGEDEGELESPCARLGIIFSNHIIIKGQEINQ